MTRRINLEIRILSKLMSRWIENSPAKKQVESVTGPNAWIIGYLAEHEGQDSYQKDLEKVFGITRSTASKVVNLMVVKGLVERQSVPGDARLKKLVLTQKGQRIHEIMREDLERMDSVITAGFSEEELEQFSSYIKRMHDNVCNDMMNNK